MGPLKKITLIFLVKLDTNFHGLTYIFSWQKRSLKRTFGSEGEVAK